MRKAILVILIICGLCIIAAGSVLGLKDNGANANLVANATPTFTPIPTPMTITDQLGRAITLNSTPQRIISLSPSNTEILFALGLGDKVVGVTTYCNYPEEALEKEKVGGFSTTDTEKLLELEPDVVFAARIHEAEIIPQLENLGIKVIALVPKTVNDVFDAITLVGEITGEEQRASELVEEMQDKIEAVTDNTNNLSEAQKPGVFYITRSDPLYTVGSETIINELIVSAGGINVFQNESGTVIVQLEAVLEANPQVIITGAKMGGAVPAFEFVKTDERLSGLDARVNDRIYEIDVDIVSRYGPRLADALEQLAKMIHPEIFGPIE